MLDLDPTTLFLSIVFSIVGIGYWSLGKKRNRYFRIPGLILMIFPYFVDNIWGLLGIGILLIIAPFVLTLMWPY